MAKPRTRKPKVEGEELAEIAPEPAAEAVEAEPSPAPKSTVFPLIFMGLVAATLGAAGAIGSLRYLPAELLPPQVDEAGLRAALSESVAQASAATEGLTKRIAALEAAPQVDLAGLNARLELLERDFAALGEKALAGDPANVQAMEQVRAEIATMKKLMAEGRDSSSAAKAQIEAAAAEAAKQITSAQAEADKLRSEAEKEALTAKRDAALTQLDLALQTGQDLPQAIAALAEAGAQIPAEISPQTPSLAQVKASFDPAAREALAEARKALAGGTMSEKIGAFFVAQTGFRSLKPQQGDGPDAVLSRIQAGIETDLAAALAELATLPAEAQEVLKPWAEQARAHLAATQALAQSKG